MEETKQPPPLKPGEVGFINPGAPNLIRLYANGFRVGPNTGDMYMIGLLNNDPSFVINMSFSTAKTLQQTLDKLIIDFEKNAEMKIPSLTDIQNTLIKNVAHE